MLLFRPYRYLSVEEKRKKGHLIDKAILYFWRLTFTAISAWAILKIIGNV